MTDYKSAIDITDYQINKPMIELLHGTPISFEPINEYEIEIEIILRLAKVTTYRDQATSAHNLRVSKYARLIASGLGWSVNEQEKLMMACSCHDIGKIGIPDYILFKQGSLTAEEYDLVKTHTTIGHDILNDSRLPLLKEAAIIALTHHEKFDGTGYPNGLAGEEIPLSSRIIAVADVFDSLLSLRTFKPTWNINQVIHHLESNKGLHFDPVCIDAFIGNLLGALKLRDSFENDLSYAFDLTSKIKLHHPEERFQEFFKSSPVGIAMIDHLTGEFLEANQSLFNYTGYSKEEFLSLTIWDITPKEYEFQEIQQMYDLNTYGHFGPNEKEFTRKDGTQFPIMIQGFALNQNLNDARKVVWIVVQDITLTKNKEQQLSQLALHDPLTGLPNRRLLSDRIQQAITHSTRSKIPFALIILDLDHFKPVNDRFGHSIGDAVLKEVGLRIKNNLIRDSDTIARIGGDEFVIILPEIQNHKSALLIAEKIKVALHKPMDIEGYNINISGSIGIALYPEHGKDEDTLYQNADDALYKSKNSGRNSIHVYELEK